jgi:hypothetical protein
MKSALLSEALGLYSMLADTLPESEALVAP